MSKSLFATEVNDGFATYPRTQTELEYSAILAISGSSDSYELPLNGLNATFPIIQILPRGETLVVAPRCYCRSDGAHDLNARVYNSYGVLTREFLLGDGIEDVQVDRIGQIWVSYFDEEVFGNYGWKTPLGRGGLNCFSATGHRVWEFDPPTGFDTICDCYALNVSREGVWAYYYTEFPIARIDFNWNVKCWTTECSGARTLAVRDKQVLLYGGYAEHRTECKLLELTENEARLAAHVVLDLPVDVDLSKAAVIGRDMELHVFSGDDWYRFSVESVL